MGHTDGHEIGCSLEQETEKPTDKLTSVTYPLRQMNTLFYDLDRPPQSACRHCPCSGHQLVVWSTDWSHHLTPLKDITFPGTCQRIWIWTWLLLHSARVTNKKLHGISVAPPLEFQVYLVQKIKPNKAFAFKQRCKFLTILLHCVIHSTGWYYNIAMMVF